MIRAVKMPAAEEGHRRPMSEETELSLVHSLARAKYGKDWIHKLGITKVRGDAGEQLSDIYALDPSLRDSAASLYDQNNAKAR
jgi:hypothetical protein